MLFVDFLELKSRVSFCNKLKKNAKNYESSPIKHGAQVKDKIVFAFKKFTIDIDRARA